MKTETIKLIEALQNEVNKTALLWNEKIYAICEGLDYKGSSKFSFNIDRLKAFVDILNETKISTN